MAYETLKSIITQNIKTNGQESITGIVLQQILLQMVDELGYTPEGDLATKEWVNTQLTDYASKAWLTNNYLPLTGGTLSGNLTVLNNSLSVVTAGSSTTSYTTTITGSGVEVRMRMTGTPIDYRSVLNENGLTLYDQNGAGTTITRSSVTSGSFIKSGGTSDQVLCADGSVKTLAQLKAALDAI